MPDPTQGFAADLAVGAVALLFAGMGVVALLRPALVLSLFDVPALTRDGRNEVRSVYGGFGLAIAGALGLGVTQPALREGVVLTVALALVGMASGRLISALIDGPPRPLTGFIGLVEVLGAAALFWAR